MGLVREPEGVDFVIQSQPLTPTDVAEIQNWIQQLAPSSKLPEEQPHKAAKQVKPPRENKSVRVRKVG